MSRHCQVTGAAPGVGRNVPWAKKRTARRLNANVRRKRYWVPSLGRHVRLTVSARGIKVIDARGIDAVVAEMIAQGKRL